MKSIYTKLYLVRWAQRSISYRLSEMSPTTSTAGWYQMCIRDRSIGSFRFTSSWGSEVILLSQRLALKYNTICRATLQAFFTSFLLFFRFCIHPLVFCLKSVPALTPTQHTCGVRLLPVGEGVALYIIRRASAAFTGQTDALSYICLLYTSRCV